MMNRWIQDSKLDIAMEEAGVGIIPFSILNQGLLTEKYIKEIPVDSRVGNPEVPFLNEGNVTEDLRKRLVKLKSIAADRDQTLAQLAISWTCVQRGISTVLIGVSRLSQLDSNLKAINNLKFSNKELDEIWKIIK